MEMELNSLIDKIKREGVQEAQKGADKVVSDARGKADEIINAAERKKADIIKNAQIEAKNFRKASEEAVKQAARDVLLSLRGRITELFTKVVRRRISDELAPDALKVAIVSAVRNFRKEGALDIEVLVSKKDRDKLQKSLFNALAKNLKAHLTLTGSSGIDKGFRIGEKGKDSYFDFTGEAVTDSFTRYLNPRLRDVLNIDKKT
jgi:V/A-type H+-transporting ATPase subunit E